VQTGLDRAATAADVVLTHADVIAAAASALAAANSAASLTNVLTLVGLWDASSGAFPATAGIKKGWTYPVSVAGTVDGQAFGTDDKLIAAIDSPSSATFASNWFKIEGGTIVSSQVTAALGFTPATAARSISAGGIATGGGDLSADRTITVTKSTGAEVTTGTDDTKAVTPKALYDAGLTPFPVGASVAHYGSTLPTGYLLRDGGQYSQTTYAGLYAVIGDTFNIAANTMINAKPWKMRYRSTDAQSTDITGWTTGTSLPGALRASQAIVTKDRVYLLGGNNGGYVATVYTAPINGDGTLGTWVAGTSLPGALGYSQAIVTNSRVYLLGGYSGGAVATVYTAPINNDGTLGTWTTGTSLPGALYASQAIVTNNRVYLLGGDGYATVYTAPINSDGTLGTWTTGTSLPGTFGYSQAIVTKDRVYLFAGYVGGAVATVYTAPINGDGTLGTWTTGTSLPGALYVSQAIVTNNRVYLLGGNAVATVYTAAINADGTLGTWTTGTSLPGALGDSQAIVVKDNVYLLGGASVATVYKAAFSGGANDYLTSTYVPVTVAGYFNLPPTRQPEDMRYLGNKNVREIIKY